MRSAIVVQCPRSSCDRDDLLVSCDRQRVAAGHNSVDGSYWVSLDQYFRPHSLSASCRRPDAFRPNGVSTRMCRSIRRHSYWTKPPQISVEYDWLVSKNERCKRAVGVRTVPSSKKIKIGRAATIAARALYEEPVRVRGQQPVWALAVVCRDHVDITNTRHRCVLLSPERTAHDGHGDITHMNEIGRNLSFLVYRSFVKSSKFLFEASMHCAGNMTSTLVQC